MDQSVIEEKVRRQLRVREPLAARELAERAGLTTSAVAKATRDLCDKGVAVKHKTRGAGDRAPRYTKARAA